AVRTVGYMPDDPERSDVPNAHDGLFRLVFGQPVHAASMLRAVLPAALTARLDLDRLRTVNGSFVNTELRWRHTDVLHSTYLDGHPALVYVLIEHQSTPDPLMPWRMLRYLVRIWERYLGEHPKAVRLPLVIPVVVHEGGRAWPAPVELSELIDVDPVTAAAAAEFVPRFRFLLEDLAGTDPAELRAELSARPLTPIAMVSLYVLQSAPRSADVAEELEQVLDTLHAVLRSPGGTEALRAMLTYIHGVSETPSERLRQVMARLGPEAEEVYVTTADTLRAEGRAEGRAEMLVQQLTLKFGPLPDGVRVVLREASMDQLVLWTGRVLTATSLDDVFA
ncbi:MAG: Rpn family recombination-promoting nuclease/putative transposase, partial [Actinomycetes bacterium]